MTFRSALLAATIVALPLAANAQPVNGLYVGAGAGINLMQDEHFKASNGTPGSLKLDLGPVAVVSLGWGFGNGLRAEIEGNYRNNTFDKFNGVRLNGNEQKFGAMVNALYDFSVAPWVSPYIGVGVGYEVENLSGFASNKGSFAYQGILGVAFPINAVPGLAVTTEYRYMGLDGDRKYNDGVKSTDNHNHSALIGIRYAFGAAPAPMAPATQVPGPVAPSRSYLVFFDWDRANLTDRARGIIKDAAVSSSKTAYTKIDVNGYSDSSGKASYNQGLSMRRAQNVAAELVRDGVPKNAIVISAFGETHPLVPTGPNVREPQNRRVEIIIR